MRYIIIFIFLFGTLPSNAQELSIGINYGIGTYWNESLKNLNQEILEDFPVEAKTTDNFPPYFYPEIELLKGLDEKFTVGGSLRYLTTGARNYYEDYSGAFYSDIITNGYALSGVGEMLLGNKARSAWSLYTRATFVYNTISLTSNLIIGESKESNTTDFFSYNLSIESGLNYKYNIGKFYIKSNLGLQVDLPSKIYLTEDSDYHLLDGEGKPVKINWSGIRFSLGVGIRF